MEKSRCASAIALLAFTRGVGLSRLIPINKIEDGKYTKSSNENIIRFRDYLNDHGIVATIRRELGSDISAACGQLRKQNLN